MKTYVDDGLKPQLFLVYPAQVLQAINLGLSAKLDIAALVH